MKSNLAFQKRTNKTLILKSKNTYSIQPLLTLLLFICIPFLANCSKPKYKNNDETFYSASSIADKALNNTVSFQQTQLHYVSIGENNGIPVVMIHGTPGNWESFKYVLGNTQLQSEFKMASIDRLGWGKSSYPKNSDEHDKTPDYKQQVTAIAAIIRHFAPKQKVILVGHSLGSSIAPRVAQEFPELVSGLLLLAGTLDPEFGAPRWYNRTANLSLIKKMIGEMMAQSNDEIMLLKESLIKTLPVWQTLTIPVTVIQGDSDKLVNPKNIHFAEQKLAHLGNKFRLIELKKVGHFIPWEQTQVIRDELILLGDKVRNIRLKNTN